MSAQTEANASSPTPSRRRKGLVVAGILAVPVLLAAGFAGYLALSGTPLVDEWVCSDGEAPVLLDGGGSACRPEGATLGEGESWDPLGNRPLSCDDRWGWTEVRATDGSAAAGDDTDCLREDAELPAGYEVVD